LRSLPLSYLKIAKEFVDGLAQSGEDLAFVRLIIELARMRELQVIAEGIEDAEQLNILRSLGCDHGQGYYFAKPLDADDPDLLAALAPIDPLAATADRSMSERAGVTAVRTPSPTLT
jgi:EAL domain-containing protein (putative c-di-GMP-specific phosphodiesterase class I)